MAVDIAAQKLILDDGEIPYDYLVLATGATHSYFGHDEWAPFAPGLKTIEDALEIRRRMLLAYEAAEREPDPERRRQWITFVVIGGGPTGVEMAGALAEIARHALTRDFRHIDPSHARMILVEGMPRVLPPYAEELSAKARTQLERLGVEVRTGARVTAIDAPGVTPGPGAHPRPHRPVGRRRGGVAARRTLGVPLDRAGRVQVNPDLTIPGHDEVFVIGDLAAIEQDGKPVPGVAPAAIQMGRQVARNIRRRWPASRGSRSATATRAASRPSAAPRRWPSSRPAQALGLPGLARVARDPHLLPDRLPQPGAGHVPLGLVLLHVPARSAPHHRRAPAAAHVAQPSGDPDDAGLDGLEAGGNVGS